MAGLALLSLLFVLLLAKVPLNNALSEQGLFYPVSIAMHFYCYWQSCFIKSLPVRSGLMSG